MNTVQILTRAKNAVKHSWAKGEYLFDGAVCAAGAIGKAIGSPDGHPIDTSYGGADGSGVAKGDILNSCRALKYLAHAVNPDVATNATDYNAGSENINVIIHWNDAAERTKAEVLAGFDRAIKMAKRRHVHG